MTKSEYKEFRKLLRANGVVAFRWWPASPALDKLQDLFSTKDYLKERQDLVEFCKETGLKFNFRNVQGWK